MNNYTINFTMDNVKHLFPLCSNKTDLSKKYDYQILKQNLYPMCIISSWMANVEYMRQIYGLPFKKFTKIYQYCTSKMEEENETSVMGISFRSSLETLLNNSKDEKIEYDFDKIFDSLGEIEKNKTFPNELSIKCLDINVNLFKIMLSEFQIPITICGFFDAVKMNSSTTSVFTSFDHNNVVYHSVCVVGYDNMTKIFKFQNSLGDEWHDSGFGYFSYDFIGRISAAFCLNNDSIKSDDDNNDNEEEFDEEILEENNEENFDNFSVILLGNIIENL